MSTWWVYMLRGSDDSLYTGVTTDVERRLKEHNGELPGGAKFTKTRRPFSLVYTHRSKNRSYAQKREAAIKQLTKAEKEKLVAQ